MHIFCCKTGVQKNPDMVELHQKKRYIQLDFSIQLIRQLGGIKKEHAAPLYTVPVVSSSQNIFFQNIRRNNSTANGVIDYIGRK